MNTGDWLGLMDLTNLELPAFLSLLGVAPGSASCGRTWSPPARSSWG
jgi:hypothetical protein